MSWSIQTRKTDSVKRLIFAALLTSAADPASAQYYYGPGYGPPPPPPGYGPPPQPDYGPPPRPYGYGPPRPYGRPSSICVTSRGTCPIAYPVPFNSPCRCDIPGFGPKRGATR